MSYAVRSTQLQRSPARSCFATRSCICALFAALLVDHYLALYFLLLALSSPLQPASPKFPQHRHHRRRFRQALALTGHDGQAALTR